MALPAESGEVPPTIVGCAARPYDVALVNAADPVSVIGVIPAPLRRVMVAWPITSCGFDCKVPLGLYILNNHIGSAGPPALSVFHVLPLNSKMLDDTVE